jgi:hypothetical protein
MPKLTSRIKKTLIYTLAATAIGAVTIQTIRADTTTDTAAAAAGGSSSAGASSDTALLQAIATYTNNILTAVTTPANPAILLMLEALFNLVAPDTSTDPATPTPALQAAFTTINFTGSMIEPLFMKSNLSSLQNDFFGGASTTSLPNANDLSFGTLIGVPYFAQDPRTSGGNSQNISPPYNYLKNASGLNITHIMPGNDWKGTNMDQNKYAEFYDTLSAVQTFNGYALSQLYFDNMLQLSTQQNALVQQVSDPKAWFSTVATETIGAVFRQILMFQSQSYVLLTQLLETLAMNNSLQVAGNMSNEGLLLMKATRKMPGTQ